MSETLSIPQCPKCGSLTAMLTSNTLSNNVERSEDGRQSQWRTAVYECDCGLSFTESEKVEVA